MMRRAAVALGIVAVGVLLLSGCVGIPTSGGVQSRVISTEEEDAQVVVLPDGPTADATPEEILEGFMLAVRAPQGNYSIARQFLTGSLSSSWAPNTSALIRTNGFVPVVVDGTNVIRYTVTTVANVNETGRYTQLPEPSTQTLAFEFAEEGGEWRISAAENGIVLSQNSFDVSFRERALYFFDPSFTYLIPDVRWFASRTALSTDVVEELLAGPSGTLLQQAVTTAFPAAISLGPEGVQSDSSSVVVDLSTEALSTPSNIRDQMRQQLAATLATANIVITAGGLTFDPPAAAAARAIVNPQVDAAVLIGTGSAFGFDGGTGVVPIAILDQAVTDGGATAATLSNDRRYAAFLADGVYLAGPGGPPQLFDDRQGLIAPSIDPFRFVWSVQGDSAASLTARAAPEVPVPVQSDLAPDSSVVSLEVSRDGARLLVYSTSGVGPQLAVYGIVREGITPVALGQPLFLPVSRAGPLDATWVDDRTVATVTTTGEVTAHRIGGPTTDLGVIADVEVTTIVGGNDGTDGLRLLSTTGEVWRPLGSASWVNTGIAASFLATKQ